SYAFSELVLLFTDPIFSEHSGRSTESFQHVHRVAKRPHEPLFERGHENPIRDSISGVGRRFSFFGYYLKLLHDRAGFEEEFAQTLEQKDRPIGEQLVRTLRRLEIDRMVEKVKRGWRELPPWVFCTDEGTPLDESRVRKAFSQALRRAKLPSFRVYDLRHTY